MPPVSNVMYSISCEGSAGTAAEASVGEKSVAITASSTESSSSVYAAGLTESCPPPTLPLDSLLGSKAEPWPKPCSSVAVKLKRRAMALLTAASC